MNARKWVTAAIIVLLLAGAAWGVYAMLPDKNLARVQDLQQQMSNENLSRDERRALFGEMREAYEQLTPAQQNAMRAEREQRWQQREMEQMKTFFALPRKEQITELDKRIKEDEKRRKEWEQRRQQRERERAQQGGTQNQLAQAGGTGGGGRGGQGGGGPGGGGGRGGFGGGGGNNLERRKAALDNSTPEQRAMRSEYRNMEQQRRQQLGLPPNNGRGGGPARWR